MPTTYNGIPFRSRLEARWAIFFDAMSTPWEYEPENFITRHGPYLPDFYLPECDSFFIVKGEGITEEEKEKVEDLAAKTERGAVIAIGQIPKFEDWRHRRYQLTGWKLEGKYMPEPEPMWDNNLMFARCRTCNRLRIVFDGLTNRHCFVEDGRWYEEDDTEMIQALELARSARYGTNFY